MDKTHYEYMVDKDEFGVKKLFKILDDDISGDNFNYYDFAKSNTMTDFVGDVSSVAGRIGIRPFSFNMREHACFSNLTYHLYAFQ